MDQDQEAKMSQQACALEQVSDRVGMPAQAGCEYVHCLSDGSGGIHIAVLTVTDLMVESSQETFECDCPAASSAASFSQAVVVMKTW